MERPDDDPDPGHLPPEGLADDIFGVRMPSQLDGFVAEARLDAAAARRRRERWLQRQASEETNLTGVLVDLAESQSAVAVRMRAGRTHQGRIEVVGSDFLVLARGELPDVVLAVGSVCAVTTRSGPSMAAGDREVVTPRTLAQLIDDLSGRRERVTLVADDGRCTVAGTLWSRGQDVVTLRLDDDRDGDHGTTYLPLAALSEVVLA